MSGPIIERDGFYNEDFSRNPTFQSVHPNLDPLLDAVSTLEERVVGQREAATSVARAVIRVRAGFVSPRRPEYVGIFLGTPGTGKTEMGNAISYLYWRSDWEKHRKIVNCAAFHSEHSTARLVGSPTGYIGWGDDAGLLFNPDFLKERNVIIFDEVEKGHPQLLKLLLGVLEGGKLEVALKKGESKDDKVENVELDFRKSTIIFTSNIGSSGIMGNRAGKGKIGFNREVEDSDIRRKALQALDRHFTIMPEFLDRIPELNRIVFNPLSEIAKLHIFDKFINELVPPNEGRGMVTATMELKKWVIGMCDPAKGARPLRDKIMEHVVDHLALVRLDLPAGVPIAAGVDFVDGKGVVRFWVQREFLNVGQQRQETIRERPDRITDYNYLLPSPN